MSGDGRAHDGRGHWLDVDEANEEVKLLRSISSNLATIRALFIFWTAMLVIGVGVSVLLLVAAAAGTGD